jgi:hypothetical protein
MAAKATIIAEINAKVGTSLSAYRIGLTHDLGERKKYWGQTSKLDISYWKAWEADSLSDAQDIERTFINRGMKGGTGGDLSSRYKTYVYVF